MFEGVVEPIISFVVYFTTGMAYVIAFTFLYVRVTPYAEIKMIREGHVAASVTLGGALIGFALPLAKAIQQSESALDLLIWATLALIIQILVFLALHILLPKLSHRVKENGLAESIILAVISIVAGLINSASMTI